MQVAGSEGGGVAKVIEVLMDEHRLIEQVLGSLETYTLEVEAGLAIERPLVADYAAFFRGFADACHHGKEENILFQRLIERGMPRETGPLAVMLHEHQLGRRHVGALREIGEGPGPLVVVESQSVLENASAFVPLLRAHILKEDRILYPTAERVLTGLELEAMEESFATFEAQWRADGSYDRLQGLAERLRTTFRPDPARMAAAADLLPCG
jgi:hemerythrin-like domain-containing protein